MKKIEWDDSLSVGVDLIDNATLKFLVFINSIHTGNKNEIEICTLRVKVRRMGHTDSVGPGFYVPSHSLPKIMEFVPGHARLQRVYHNTEIV